MDAYPLGEEAVPPIWVQDGPGRLGRFSRLCISIAALRAISMTCAALGSAKMGMHAFPLVIILGGNAHLEAERYCNAVT